MFKDLTELFLSVCVGQDNFGSWLSPSTMRVLGNSIQSIMFDCLYPLSHLAGPRDKNFVHKI